MLGTEGSIDALLNTLPDQSFAVGLPQGTYWFHEPDEGEWFYLVGGYRTLTGLYFFKIDSTVLTPESGKGGQTQDLSWWPKITT